MLADLFTLILYPIQELLKLFLDENIEAYLGVSLMHCIVTGMIMLIVFRSLVNPAGVGSMAVERENIETAKSNKAAALDNAAKRNKFYKASVDFMRDNKK